MNKPPPDERGLCFYLDVLDILENLDFLEVLDFLEILVGLEILVIPIMRWRVVWRSGFRLTLIRQIVRSC